MTNDSLTWTQRIERQVAFLNRIKRDATTNKNGGTVVFAGDAAMLDDIIKDLNELSSRIPKQKADYDS